MATQAFTTTGAQTWTVPSGVSSIQVECYGGGGGGASIFNGKGGGGGGYAKVNTISVSAGQTVYVNVGTGGPASTAGGNSWVNVVVNSEPSSTTNGAVATGGAAATGSTKSGAGGVGLLGPNTSFSGGTGG